MMILEFNKCPCGIHQFQITQLEVLYQPMVAPPLWILKFSTVKIFINQLKGYSKKNGLIYFPGNEDKNEIEHISSEIKSMIRNKKIKEVLA